MKLCAIAVCGFMATTTLASAEKYYVVERGDTLSSIAEKNMGSAQKWLLLCELNQIQACDRIHIGQKLIIPNRVESDNLQSYDVGTSADSEILSDAHVNRNESDRHRDETVDTSYISINELPNFRFEETSIGHIPGEGRVARGHNFFNSDSNGTRQIIDWGSDDSGNFIVVQTSGNDGTSLSVYRFSQDTEIPARRGELWLAGFSAQLVNGTIPAGVEVFGIVHGRDINGKISETAQSSDLSGILEGGEPVNIELSMLIRSTETAFITSEIRIISGSGASYDIQLRLRNPFMQESSVSSNEHLL